jgi:hypothetical protein
MTGPSDRVVVCYQCGASNDAGDQFCGNCGVFLEWAAEPAAVAAPEVDPGAADGFAAAPDAPSTSGAFAVPNAPNTSGAFAAAPDPMPVGLVRCPTCATANVASRTFCTRCGNVLAGAAATRLPLPPRAEPSSRVRAPDASGSVPERVRRREPERGRRGLSGWLLLGGAGIAVAAVVVVAALLLGSGKPPPPAAASSAPSASVSASHRPSAAPSKAVKTARPKASK